MTFMHVVTRTCVNLTSWVQITIIIAIITIAIITTITITITIITITITAIMGADHPKGARRLSRWRTERKQYVLR